MSEQPQIEVTLPDGSVRSIARGATIRDVAESIGPRLAQAAIGGVVNDGEIIDVHTPLFDACALKIVTLKTPEDLRCFGTRSHT